MKKITLDELFSYYMVKDTKIEILNATQCDFLWDPIYCGSVGDFISAEVDELDPWFGWKVQYIRPLFDGEEPYMAIYIEK